MYVYCMKVYILLYLFHQICGATRHSIKNIRPNEATTTKLSFDFDNSNHTSALVIHTRVLPNDGQTNEIEESTLNSTSELFFTAIFNGFVNHWSMNIESQQESSKFLCQYTKHSPLQHHLDKKSEVSLGIFSINKKSVALEIEAKQTKFDIDLDEQIELTLNGGSSEIIQFIPDNMDSKIYGENDGTYLISIMSELANNYSNCLYIALNHPGCPLYDNEQSIRSSRMWARMLKVGYFPVQPGIFPNGFFISIVPASNSSECWSHTKNTIISPTNPLKIKIEKTLNSYATAVVISISVIFLISIVFSILIIWSWCHNIYGKSVSHMKNDEMENEGEANVGGDLSRINKDRLNHMEENHDPATVSEQSIPGGSNESASGFMRERKDSAWNNLNAYRKTLINDIKKVYDDRCDSKSEHCKFAIHRLEKGGAHKEGNQHLNLTDMTKMMDNHWHRRQRSKSYIYLIPLVSIFYLIPSAQMVYTEYMKSWESGNLEKCYLNYGCSRPYGILTDFNHIISNIGYLIYGIVFIGLVYIKSRLLPDGMKVFEDHKSAVGLLQQHSIFYSMGISMIFQGLFSSIFHMCPSNISLQFDTTVMYIMMILVFIKIYQLRHPDIAYNAYHTMYAFSVVLIYEAVSLYVFDYKLRLLLYLTFLLLYLMLMVHVALDIYYYGALKTNPAKLIPIFLKHAYKYKAEVLYRNKLILAFLFVIINCSIVFFIMGSSFKEPGKSLSTPILIIGGTNIILYILYYYFKKFTIEIRPQLCPTEADMTEENGEGQINERQKRQKFLVLMSFILQLLTVFVGMLAAYFYANKHQSRNSSPPESRNKNDVCRVMDFFDNHDMWHFTSATALFLAFLGLLIVDDDILFTPKENIRVF